MIPIIYQNKVNALLGLGKRENLMAYRKRDLELLKKLSQEIGITIFNALHFEDLAEKERLEQELSMGRQIQMSLLPLSAPVISNLLLQGMTMPAREIGGDYYDFIVLPKENNLAIVIGDVSGKGVAAGLCMAMVKTSVHIFARNETSPKQILVHINQVLNQHIGGEKFMTMLYLIWDADNSTIHYSSAGHEHILVYRKETRSVDVIQSGGTILGIIDDIDPFLEEKNIRLEPGDKVLLYTDGVTEAHNTIKERFGLERLAQSFKNNIQRDSQDLIQAVKSDVNTFIGDSFQYDDITLVALEAQ
ncbi:MAG: PP2C family protein-serine/threonine phosphatase [bacterium]|nr:PP2C family protein-serine/threonine phosphatase [bacterium]